MRTKAISQILLLLIYFASNGAAADAPARDRTRTGRTEVAPFAVTVTGRGRPMILIPGLACGGNVWDGTIAHFKDRFECHVVTLAGFAGQPAIGEPFLEQIRDGLIQYIRDRHLDHPVIVGHSLGAFMAFWIAATTPDQIGPVIAVDGTPYFPALLDKAATPQLVTAQAEGMRTMLQAQTPDQFAAGQRAFLGRMITDAKDVEMVASLSTKSDPKAVAQAFYEMMTLDLRPKVKAIQSPVLIIGATVTASNAEQKKLMEDNYRAQLATISRHKVVFAPKSRHFIQLDAQEYFIQVVEAFLKDAIATSP